MMSVSEQTLMNELNKIRRQNISKKYKEISEYEISETTEYTSQPQTLFFEDKSEREVIRCLLSYGMKEISFTIKNEDDHEEENKLNVAVFM